MNVHFRPYLSSQPAVPAPASVNPQAPPLPLPSQPPPVPSPPVNSFDMNHQHQLRQQLHLQLQKQQQQQQQQLLHNQQQQQLQRLHLQQQQQQQNQQFHLNHGFSKAYSLPRMSSITPSPSAAAPLPGSSSSSSVSSSSSSSSYSSLSPAFSSSSNSLSPHPNPTSKPNPNISAASSASSTSNPSPFDQFAALHSYKLHQQRQQQQQQQILSATRSFNLHSSSPLSPQESSTISFSDSSSSPYQSGHRQQHLIGVQNKSTALPKVRPTVFPNILNATTAIAATTTSSNNNSNQSINNTINRNNNTSNTLTGMPIVCGPGAFQTPSSNPNPNLNQNHARRLDNEARPLDECKRIKRTLEDLERELLGDDCDAVTASITPTTPAAPAPELSNIIERDWTDAIQDLFSAESTSLPVHAGDQSTMTCTSSVVDPSRTEAALRPHLPLSPKPDSSSQTKDLLLSCAKAIDDGNLSMASSIKASLELSVSIYGDPMQRLAAYMAEGLAAKIKSAKEGHFQFPSKYKDLSALELFRVQHNLQTMFPLYKFGYLAACGFIADACRSDPRVHIIDFDISHGIHWNYLLKAFAQRPGGPPHVRLTGIADAKSPTNLEGVGNKLKETAKSAGINLEFIGVRTDVAMVQPFKFERYQNEALVVNFAFQLHDMPDESVDVKNPRDSLLRMVRAMEPKVVTLIENEANTNTSPFYPRFVETLNYFSAIFESLDAGKMPRDSKDRVTMEQHCLASEIVNIIACEGPVRTKRYEVAGKWKLRMKMAGFRPSTFRNPFIIKAMMMDQFKSYSPNYKLREDNGTWFLDWRERALVTASAWQ